MNVVGGGLAGCEAAFQLALRGVHVTLFEQKLPSKNGAKRTPAQTSDRLAELVCSNSFRSTNPENAVGLLKEEMKRLGSFIVACAEESRVPAGDALAVDRERFADRVEREIRKRVTVVAQEVTALPDPDSDVPTLIATGPLTSDALAAAIAKACGKERLAFYDAIAPIVEADSIEREGPFGAYALSRWGKGDGDDYLNCPMNRGQYEVFLAALLEADRVHAKEFEDLHYFEGCLPLEVMAERGPETLRFGPLKPVGLEHPQSGWRPHAVLQLRKEDVHGTAYNLVGCQTRLKQPAQKAVLSLVPALSGARFLRYGALHRNTYLDAPAVLDDMNRLVENPSVFFAGQITGVEGYVESTASGLLTALVIADLLDGRPFSPEQSVPPPTTALGGLWRHTRGAMRAHADGYAPSNVMWPMMPPVCVPDLPSAAHGPGAQGKPRKLGKGEKRKLLVERARADLTAWLAER